MTLLTAAVVTAVVWGVGLIRPVRWRALAYSLPLPMAVVLATTTVPVDGGQLVGVVGLVTFFAVVTLAHHRLSWPIALADAAGITWYVALGLVTARLGPVPFWPALAVVGTLWAATALALHRRSATPSPPPGPRTGHPLARLAVIAAAALLMVLLGQSLAGLIVTFPYSGVLVAVDSRRELPAFTRHFAVNSVGLLAFLTAVYALGLGAGAG